MPRFTQAQVDAYNARQSPLREPVKLSGAESESGLQEQIFAECRRRRWICFHGAMSERTHRTLGEWDFTILADAGRVFFIECKTRTGKLRPEQQAMLHAARALGHAVHVCRSFQDFLAVCPS